MQTTNNKEELQSALLKMAIVAAMFMAGCLLNYLETIAQ